MAPKDILLFSDEFPPEGGGAGIVARQLAKGLRALGRKVELLIGASKGSRAADAETHTCRRFTLAWPFLYGWRLLRMRAWRYRHFVLNDYIAAYLAGLWFTPAMLRRSVVLVHGADGEFFFAKSSLKHRLFGYTRCYRRTLRHCGRVVAASAYAMDTFLQHASAHVDRERVGYAYMGIDPADLGEPQGGDKAALGVPADALLLFSASRLIEEKGLLDMLALFDEARRTLPKLYWHIAGSGPLRGELEERIARLGLQDRVRLLGQLPRDRLARYYSQADVFWLLSKRKGETFGLVYTEAAWFGCPSIALRMAGVPEAIAEGVSGYFHEAGSDPARLIQMAAQLDRDACRQHARRFLSSAFAEHIHQLLSDPKP